MYETVENYSQGVYLWYNREMNNKTFISSIIVVVLFAGAFWASNNMSNKLVSNQGIEITPIEHATMVMKWNGKTVYTDPVGGAQKFAGQPEPDLILLTDIHSDHFDVSTLEAVSKVKTLIITPMAVADKIPSTVAGELLVMKNGQKTNAKTAKKVNLNGFEIEAIPMYNLPASPELQRGEPEKADAYHTKGRGNGYVISDREKRVYISGDTADIPEMRALKNIDIAFVSMNLPYTMSVESAASGVLAMKPKQVYPYHYRGTDGLADINKFKELVNKGNPSIDVVLLNWYP